MLHACFEEEVEPALERDDFAGVVVGFARVANDEATGELVEAVQAEHGCCFAWE